MDPEDRHRAATSLSTQKYALEIPSLDDIAAVFKTALDGNFRDASVRIVDCPDLTEHPFGMASKGISGSTKIADVGGVRYLIPSPQLDHTYDLQSIAKASDLTAPYCVFGPGCGPYHEVGCNCERTGWLPDATRPCNFFANIAVSSGGKIKNESRIAKLDKDGKCHVETLQSTNLAILGNFFLSAGQPGKVVEVRAKGRTGSENFVSILRQAVRDRYQGKPVGIGGIFLVEKGKVNIHVMPDFSKVPLVTEDAVDKWLKYFTQSAPMVFMSVFVSEDPGWDLRCEHTHGYGVLDIDGSSQNRGGHYHYDTTPDEVEYVGYFNCAETLYRIDRPPSST